jgi:ketosteroid isomerase-like protein
VGTDNVDIARSAIEEFNRGDLEALFGRFTDDAEVYSTDELPNSGLFRGREGYLEWVGAWLDAWVDFTVEPLAFEPIGDRHVLARVRQRGRGRQSGVEIGMEAWYLFELRDTSLRRFSLYADRASAIAAVPAQAT